MKVAARVLAILCGLAAVGAVYVILSFLLPVPFKKNADYCRANEHLCRNSAFNLGGAVGIWMRGCVCCWLLYLPHVLCDVSWWLELRNLVRAQT